MPKYGSDDKSVETVVMNEYW